MSNDTAGNEPADGTVRQARLQAGERMAGFLPDDVERILGACSANLEAIASSFNLCFDLKTTMSLGESGVWSETDGGADFRGSGVVVLFRSGTQALAMLIPGSLRLPDWYMAPNDSQQARLQTLGMEWSLNLLPEDFEFDEYFTLTATSIQGDIDRMKPADWACCQEWTVDFGAGPPGKMLMVWPLDSPKMSTTTAHGVQASAPEAPSEPKAKVESLSASAAGDGDPFGRLRQVPVTVSVRLAEKQLPLSQVLAISPGTLISFSKSCEDLLDLYVNNSLYCQGEAVKIGENFGLKINKVRVKIERKAKIVLD